MIWVEGGECNKQGLESASRLGLSFVIAIDSRKEMPVGAVLHLTHDGRGPTSSISKEDAKPDLILNFTAVSSDVPGSSLNQVTET